MDNSHLSAKAQGPSLGLRWALPRDALGGLGSGQLLGVSAPLPVERRNYGCGSPADLAIQRPCEREDALCVAGPAR